MFFDVHRFQVWMVGKLNLHDFYLFNLNTRHKKSRADRRWVKGIK